MANRQLEEIYEEITHRFSRHPAVKITPLGGDPPEKYQIRYLINGLHKEDSDMDPNLMEEHVITISIPFGFPHFPPSCVPDSPVFHPDFDPAAICIGEFWSPDKKLPELIIHLGQLISGEKYSTENAFNEEAATWYQQHSDRLPLTTFPVDAVVEVDAGELSADDLDDVSDDLELDVIDDHDLADDFSYLSMEDNLTVAKQHEPPSLSLEASDQAPDNDLISLLKKKKRYHALNDYLHNLSSSIEFDGKSDLAESTEIELQKAQQLYGEAETFEHEGNPVKSLQKYKEVSLCVSDFPGIEEDIKRAEQSVELLGGFDETRVESALPDINEESTPTKPSKPEKKKREVSQSEDKVGTQSKNYIAYTIGGALVLCLLGAGFIYYTNSSRYAKANQTFAQCQDALEKHDFSTTDTLCNEALVDAKKIRFLKTDERDQLINNIEQTLSSETLQQGLAGNVKYNDHYISIASFESIEKFNKLVVIGEKSYSEEDWIHAVDYVSQAIEIAAANPDIDQSLLPQLKEKQNKARFFAAYNKGVELTHQKLWKEAGLELTTATTALSHLEKETQNKYKVKISHLHQEVSYHSLLRDADDLYDSGQWEQADVTYKEILSKNDVYLETHPEQVSKLQEKIATAELYSAIQAGKVAFSNSNWDLAIEKYNSAINLLNENKQSLSEVSSEENSKKLSRIKLQASIIRDQQGAALELKKKNYTQAIENFQSIIKSINQSPFSAEEEFFLVMEDTKKSVELTRDEMSINSKTDYLNKNYQKIFIENFPAATPESLGEPKIEYVKKIDDKLLFKMECLETGGGRPLRLVINYLFDPATGKWSFYTP